MTPLLDARNISKQFSGVPVLKGIDFTLLAGQVHALMGGNGAGKSTLMKIIAGVETPDSGELSVEGQSYARLTPAQAHGLGIYLVPQEPLLFPNLTVRENILFRLPRERDREKRLAEKLQQLQCQLNLDAAASTLEVADQQMVEILRGLMRNARILILDEPTASLTPGETERLFRQIRALQALGVGIVFISHKLPEIRMLSSHVSVMRDGAVVLSGETAQFDDSALIAAMTPVSREKSLSDTQKLWLALPGNRRTQPQDFPVLRVEDLTGEGFIDLSLEIFAGEIVGLAGLVGSGRTEFAETLYGLRPVRGGRVWLENQDFTAEPVSSRLEKGLVYLPEDRQVSGLFLDAPIRWNTVALNEPSLWQQRKRESAAEDWDDYTASARRPLSPRASASLWRSLSPFRAFSQARFPYMRAYLFPPEILYHRQKVNELYQLHRVVRSTAARLAEQGTQSGDEVAAAVMAVHRAHYLRYLCHRRRIHGKAPVAVILTLLLLR